MTRTLFIALLLLTAAGSARAADLVVRLDGLPAMPGMIMVGVYGAEDGFVRALELYDSPDGFIRDRGRVAGAALTAGAAVRTVSFSGLTPGRYAVIAFHDANADGRLDKNLLGVPTESYGFSNGAAGFLGPPDFEAAAFAVAEPKREIAIDLGE